MTKPTITAEALSLCRNHPFATDEHFLIDLSEALARLHSSAPLSERLAVLNKLTAEHGERTDADAIAAARAEAAAAERERIAAILRAPEAQSNEAFARALAFGGDMPAADAIAALKTAPRPAEPPIATGLRSADAPGGLVILGADGEPALADTPPISISPADPPKAGADRIAAMWKSTIERLNAEGGAKAAPK